MLNCHNVDVIEKLRFFKHTPKNAERAAHMSPPFEIPYKPILLSSTLSVNNCS